MLVVLQLYVDDSAQDGCSGGRFDLLPCADVLDEVASAAPAVNSLDLRHVKDAVRVGIAAKRDFKIVCGRTLQLEMDLHVPHVRAALVDDHVR